MGEFTYYVSQCPALEDAQYIVNGGLLFSILLFYLCAFMYVLKAFAED